MFLMFSEALKATFALIVSEFFGKLNLQEGMFSTEGIKPIGVGLQDPVVIWAPLVRGVPGRVRAQKLM